MGKGYTTIGTVYDMLIDKYRQKGRTMLFPEILTELKDTGMLQPCRPVPPDFRTGMSAGEFWEYIRSVPILAEEIIHYRKEIDPTVNILEAEIFPEQRDVFCLLNMPYITERLHYHDFFDITHVLKGTCRFFFEGETVTLSEGDICIVSPMSGHSLPMEPGCISVSVIVRKSTFDSVFANLLTKDDLLSLFFRNSLYESRRTNYILLKTGNDQMTLNAMQELVYETNLEDDKANACAVSLLNLYLARAMRATNAVTLRHYEGYAQRDFSFTVVLQYIQQNYRTVTLSSLAKAFHFSETYLSKLIHRQMNQSFTDVLRTLKMNHAIEYLTNTSMKVSEIAEAVGYDSVDHFSRTFRKTYGLSPLEYKKQYLSPETK